MHIVDVELGLVFVIDDYLGPTCEVYWESYGSRVEDQALLFRGRERGERRLGKSCRAQFRFIQNEMECFLTIHTGSTYDLSRNIPFRSV